MKCVLVALGLNVFALAFAESNAFATPEECQTASQEYQSAKSDVESYIRSYEDCISSNDGHDDCSSEFFSLKSSQDDFESAVSNYESECN